MEMSDQSLKSAVLISEATASNSCSPQICIISKLGVGSDPSLRFSTDLRVASSDLNVVPDLETSQI